ncbi:uncharacterized protein LOC119441722 [Dermacentor silvarum]|uniref:uncharacterized protein LOC119441722 n=1 Tax=Dermacentor silvarum TaxID=543639 RepID=UPI00210113F0|nr:uncharacterized protein LOC119441722 [Dermacentor silvarum]
MDGSTNGPISQSEQEVSHWLVAVAIAFSVFIIVLAAALVLQFYYPGIVPRFGRSRRLPRRAEGNLSGEATTGSVPRALLRPCGTAGCDRYARLFISQLNRSVDPCQDLRAFSCVARPRWRHSLRDEVVENASRAAMVNAVASGSSGSAVAKTSTFYRTCVASKTPLDLQSLRAFLATAAADTVSTMPDSSKAFQVMSKMAARYGNGILFRLGTGFVPENDSRIERPALVMGLNSDFKRWMQKAKRSTEVDAHQKIVDLVLSLSMSRDDFGWRNVSDDVMAALRIVKEIWKSHNVSRSQWSLTNVSQMGVALMNIKPAVLLAQLWQWGASYAKEHPVVLEQSSILSFLDAVLERVNERHMVQYLFWETARQLSTFFLQTNLPHLDHVCYIKTVELFGPAAVLAPVIWHQVSAEAVVSAETTFASVLKASEDAIYEAGARSMAEANRMRALGRRVSQVRLVVSYPEDVRDLLALNEKLAHVPGMSEVFFTNLLAAQESSWNRKKKNPSLPIPLRPRPHYDGQRNEITLPIDFLIPPWFSPVAPPSARLATIGLSLSLVLWRAIVTQRVYDVGESSRHLLSRRHGSNHTCLPGSAIRGTDDAFRRLAVMAVVRALKQVDNSSSDGSAGISGHSAESAWDDLELLLVSCCLSMCGPHNSDVCTAVMETPQFGSVFRCTRKSDVDRVNCSEH